MPALVCDICGGMLKVVNGKIAICESCGMEHSLERVREKYLESKNVVHTDNAHLIDNYFAMAKDAFDAGNEEAAEEYCNKILEIDPTQSATCFLKGKAVGWQSCIGTIRFKEAAVCFANAINSASEEDRASLHLSIEKEFKSLATSLIKLRCDRFSSQAHQDEADGFLDDLCEINSAVVFYETQTAFQISRNKVFCNIPSIVQLCMNLVAIKIKFEYVIDGSKRAYSRFITKTDSCIEIIQKTIDLCDDDSSDVQLYELCIEMLDAVISNDRMDSIQNRWGAYIETPRLLSCEKSKKIAMISTFRTKIQLLENQG